MSDPIIWTYIITALFFFAVGWLCGYAEGEKKKPIKPEGKD